MLERGNGYISRLLLWCIGLLCLLHSVDTHAQSKEALRYEIDAKRGNLHYISREALPRGREFKRIDSSYYVGWMFEGGYKYEHAADYLGYELAAQQLERARVLLEKDFKKHFSRTADIMTYIQSMRYRRDWDFINYALTHCYSNTDNVSALWKLLRHNMSIDLQDEFLTETFNMMAWTVHRNRFYTAAQYPFLKNSIDENVQYANRLLDSSAKKIKRDQVLLQNIFSINLEKEKMPGVWHYKSILYSYLLNMESAGYYYNQLKSTSYFPKNNYATFCMIQGKFAEAERYYKEAQQEEGGDKRMQESYYYASILNTFANNNKKSLQDLQSLLKANGSTPGFGWYQIALGRNQLYMGDLAAAGLSIEKANQFRELHIGTTLGQNHYEMSVEVLQLARVEKQLRLLHNADKYWWLKPKKLYRTLVLYLQRYVRKVHLINQLAANPERDQVMYKLFSSESTISFDEVNLLKKGFTKKYFIKKFKADIETDKRKGIIPYFRLLLGNTYLENKDHKNAAIQFASILSGNHDVKREKLLLARAVEGLLLCEQFSDSFPEDSLWKQWCSLYPQLIPFGEARPKLRLELKGDKDLAQRIYKVLHRCRIDWVASPSGSDYPICTIECSQSPLQQRVKLSLHGDGGEVFVTEREFDISKQMMSQEQWLMAIFGVQKEGNTTLDIAKSK